MALLWLAHPENRLDALQWTALFGSSMFAGFGLSCSLVLHPAAHALSQNPKERLRFWAANFRKFVPTQIGFIAMGTASGIGLWLSGKGKDWLIGSGLLFLNLPYTALVIQPFANKHLLEIEKDQTEGTSVSDSDDDRITSLLNLWIRLHNFRIFLGLTSFAFMLKPLILGK